MLPPPVSQELLASGASWMREAGTIFKPGKGSNKRRFDQAADAYTQARSEIRKRTLRAETLEGMRTGVKVSRIPTGTIEPSS